MTLAGVYVSSLLLIESPPHTPYMGQQHQEPMASGLKDNYPRKIEIKKAVYLLMIIS